MKKMLSVLLATFIIAESTYTYAATIPAPAAELAQPQTTGITVMANGVAVTYPGKQPYKEGSSVMVPVKETFEALGWQVALDPAKQTATATFTAADGGQRLVFFTQGQQKFMVRDTGKADVLSQYEIWEPLIMVDGTFYISVDAVDWASLDWRDGSRITSANDDSNVYIKSKGDFMLASLAAPVEDNIPTAAFEPIVWGSDSSYLNNSYYVQFKGDDQAFYKWQWSQYNAAQRQEAQAIYEAGKATRESGFASAYMDGGKNEAMARAYNNQDYVAPERVRAIPTIAPIPSDGQAYAALHKSTLDLGGWENVALGGSWDGITPGTFSDLGTYRTAEEISTYKPIIDGNSEVVGWMTESEVYDKLIALKSRYPDGMTWEGNPDGLELVGPGTDDGQGGCTGFAREIQLALFGWTHKKMQEPGANHKDFSQLHVGDVIHYFGAGVDHVVVVLEVLDDGFLYADGNHNSKITWGNKDTFQWFYDHVSRGGDYWITTAYSPIYQPENLFTIAQ